jgi:general nucleoside transport system permease protein
VRTLTWSDPRTVAGAGIVLGLLALWLALPPVDVRSPLVPVAAGVLAFAAAIWALSRGQRRLGAAALAAGVGGTAVGALATQASGDDLDSVFIWSALLAAMLRFATPLVFAAIGGLFSERAGVANIGLEGMMLAGAFFAILAADKTGSWLVGLGAAMLAGGALAFVHAVFSIHLRADQIVTGTAINFLALGLTGYLYIDVYGTQGVPSGVARIPDVTFPGHEDVYFVGPVLGDLNLLVWLGFVVVAAAYVVLFKTPFGLRIRAVGEHPRAADTVGISVYGVRYACVTVSGVLAALGGAYLSIGFVGQFAENMTRGRGFIALAALIFGNWRPLGAFAAALLFGFSSALAQRLPEFSESGATLFETLPYVLTLIAVAGVIGRSLPPAAIGRPYRKH